MPKESSQSLSSYRTGPGYTQANVGKITPTSNLTGIHAKRQEQESEDENDRFHERMEKKCKEWDAEDEAAEKAKEGKKWSR